MYARRPFSGSSSSNTGSGSSTDTKAPTGNLKKTLFKTFEGQQFVTYNLEVENAAGWVMRNQLSDVMYSGGLGADTRTVHEIKNYKNQLGGELVRYMSDYFGPSGVRALPLAAGRNEGGHYFRYFIPLTAVVIGPSVLRAPAEQTKVATVFGN